MHSLFKNKALYLALLLSLAGCAGKTSTVTVGGVAVEMPEEVKVKGGLVILASRSNCSPTCRT